MHKKLHLPHEKKNAHNPLRNAASPSKPHTVKGRKKKIYQQTHSEHSVMLMKNNIKQKLISHGTLPLFLMFFHKLNYESRRRWEGRNWGLGSAYQGG